MLEFYSCLSEVLCCKNRLNGVFELFIWGNRSLIERDVFQHDIHRETNRWKRLKQFQNYFKNSLSVSNQALHL